MKKVNKDDLYNSVNINMKKKEKQIYSILDQLPEFQKQKEKNDLLRSIEVSKTKPRSILLTHKKNFYQNDTSIRREKINKKSRISGSP